MNAISAFFVRNIILVFFFYGTAFFVMGLALVLAGRQTSQFRFAQAIRPLAGFGILHGIHEWIEMFQKIAILTSGYTPGIPDEVARLTILAISFLMLLVFGVSLLSAHAARWWQEYGLIIGLSGIYSLGLVLVNNLLKPNPAEFVGLADVLIRYGLGIPGAVLGTWALMAQQRTFREHNLAPFGRDLVWCAAALFLYGVIGQIFVRQTALVPSNILNSTLFLQWFGIPVQLFRGIMAAVLTFYMVRALKVFELENQRQLERANQAQLAAQATALEAERRVSREKERLNKELQQIARELSLLLDLSNLLAAPMSLQNRLRSVLKRIVSSLNFFDEGMILLVERETGALSVQVTTGFPATDGLEEKGSRYSSTRDLGEQCVAGGVAMCRHLDGEVIEFSLTEALEKQECRLHASPMTMVALPLIVKHQVIGSIVLAQPIGNEKRLMFAELKLILGIAQQLGLSIENVRLYQEAQKREKMLGELLHQVVGAQEAERQRIARELHDATGQSLAAISLGLRGVEAMLATHVPLDVEQIRELKTFGTNALGELQQLIADLRPPQLDDLGLIAAIQWYAQAFEKHRSIRTDFIVAGDRVRLPSEYETVLFRITQEALTNIAKHANASQAIIRLETYPTQICLTIEDNGRGFDPKVVLSGEGHRVGWGLLGIRERALLLGGQHKIDSAPGRGTRIRVTVPLGLRIG